MAQADDSWKINLKNADIREFVTQVSAITGKSFIIDPRVEGRCHRCLQRQYGRGIGLSTVSERASGPRLTLRFQRARPSKLFKPSWQNKAVTPTILSMISTRRNW